MSNKHGSKWIRPAKRLAIYARDGFACVFCGEEERLTLDHVLPREMGGTHKETNLVTACLSCNSAKRALTMRAWFAMLRDRGIETEGLAKKIKTHTAKPLNIALGKKLLKARK